MNKVLYKLISVMASISLATSMLVMPVSANEEPLFIDDCENTSNWSIVSNSKTEIAGVEGGVTGNAIEIFNNSNGSSMDYNGIILKTNDKINFEKGCFYKATANIKADHNNEKYGYSFGTTSENVYVYRPNFDDTSANMAHQNGYNSYWMQYYSFRPSKANVWNVMTTILYAKEDADAELSFWGFMFRNDSPKAWIDDIKLEKIEFTSSMTITDDEGAQYGTQSINVPESGEIEYNLSSSISIGDKPVSTSADYSFGLAENYTGVSIVDNKLIIDSSAATGDVVVEARYMDNVFCNKTVSLKSLPVAQNVRIDGAGYVGELIKMSYDYYDKNGVEESGTTFQWYSDGVAIEGATGTTTSNNTVEYEVKETDIDKTITVGVTPKNNDASGFEVISSNSVVGYKELLSHGRFENGMGSWSAANGTLDYETSTVHSGVGAAKLAIDEGKSYAYIKSEELQLHKGNFYAVSGWVKGNDSDSFAAGFGAESENIVTFNNDLSGGVTNAVSLSGSNAIYDGGLSHGTTTTDWKQYNYILYAKEDTNISLSFIISREESNVSSDKIIYIDDIACKKMTVYVTDNVPESIDVREEEGDVITNLNYTVEIDGDLKTDNITYKLDHAIDGVSLDDNTLTVSDTVNEGTIIDISLFLTSGNAHLKKYSIPVILSVSVKPEAENVELCGDIEVAKEIEAKFVYYDANDDAQGQHKYQWFIADDKDGTNETAINIEPSISNKYTIDTSFKNKYIKVRVTPVSAYNGGEDGNPSDSDYYLVNAQNIYSIGNMETIYNNQRIYKSEWLEYEITDITSHGGKSSLKVIPPTSETDNINKGIGFDWFDAPVGKFYTVEAWVKSPTAGTANIFSTFSLSNPCNISNNGITITNTNTGANVDLVPNQWTKVESIMYKHSNRSETNIKEQFAVRIINGGMFDIAYIDDVSIREIDINTVYDMPSEILIPQYGSEIAQEIGAAISVEGNSVIGNDRLQYKYNLDDEYEGVKLENNILTVSGNSVEQTIRIRVSHNDIICGINEIKTVCPAERQSPIADSLVLRGALADGSGLSIDYNFYDPRGLAENIDALQCVWEGKTQNGWSIFNSTGKTYTLNTADLALYTAVRARVKVVNSEGQESAEQITNEAVAPQVPTANNVAILGDISNNGTARAAFEYFDENQDKPGEHIYEWLIADDETGKSESVVQSGTEATYTIPNGSYGKYIKVKVTPVSIAENGFVTDSKWYYIDTDNILNTANWQVLTSNLSVADDTCVASPIAGRDKGNIGLVVTLRNTSEPKVATHFDYEEGGFYRVKFSAKLKKPSADDNKTYISVGGTDGDVYTFTTNFSQKSYNVGSDKKMTLGVYGKELSDSWKDFEEVIFSSGAGTNKLSFNIINMKNKDYSDLYIDNIKVYKMNNPLTVFVQEEIPIVPYGSPEQTYSCSGKVIVKANEIKLENGEIKYTLKDEYQGIFIDEEGKLKITDDASAGNYTLVGTYYGATKEFPFSILNNTGSDKPQIKNSRVVGSIKKGTMLEATYRYYDPNGALEDKSNVSYKWYARENSTDVWIPLSNSGSRLSILSTFAYKEVKAKIQVINENGIVSDEAETNIAYIPSVPTASDVKISGNHFVGEKLTGEYTYSDINANDKEKDSIYQWYRLNSVDDANPVAITEPVTDKKAMEYTITDDDIGKFIQFVVKPVSDDNSEVSEGLPAKSDAFEGPVPPTVTTVNISGTATVGNSVMVYYDYNHKYGALEDKDGTTITWYNKGVQVGTGNSLRITSEMTNITAKVKIKSVQKPYDGNEVTSNSISAKQSGGGSGGGGGGTVSSKFGNTQPPATTKSPTITQPPTETEKNSFDDIQSHWAKTQIEKMVEKGIVKGVSDKIFEPDRQITRAEACSLLCRIFSFSDYDETSSFSDVVLGEWYYNDVQAALKAGIVSGFDGKFNPNANIARQEMAKMIMSVIEQKLGSVSASENSEFADMGDVSEWAVDAINYLAETEILKGSEGKVNPKDSVTRAQAVVMLDRVMELLNETQKTGGTADK